MKRIVVSAGWIGWLALSLGLLASASQAAPNAVFTPADATMKDVVIRLGQNQDAAVGIDTELLRVSGGWTGKFGEAVKFMPRGQFSTNLGTGVFASEDRPGWGSKANLKDPRPKPEGPLPTEWGRYRGMFNADGRVVLSYSVWSSPVLELPEYNSTNGVFSRTIRIEKSDVPMALLVCATPPHAGKVEFIEKVGNGQHGYIALNATNDTTAAAIQGAPKEASWEIVEGHLYLRLPPMEQPTKFRVSIWKGDKDEGLTQFIENLARNNVIVDPKTLIGD